MLPNRKKFYVKYLLILLLGLISVVLTIESNFQNFPTGELLANGERINQRSLYAFFLIFDGNRTMLFIFLVIFTVAPLIIAVDYYNIAFNKFDVLMISRIGNKKFFINKIIYSFTHAFIFLLAIEVFSLLYLHLKFAPLDFSGYSSSYLLFSNDAFTNLLVFIVLSSSGYGLLQVFFSSIVRFIKNKYVFYCSGMLLVFGSLLIYIGLVSIIEKIITIDLFSNYVIGSFIPINLVTPGLMFAKSGIVSFVSSSIFYIIMVLVLMLLEIKDRRLNG